MSYILDALQRADQERNLGEVPKLDVALQSNSARQRRSWLPTALLIVVVAVVVATAIWLYEQRVIVEQTSQPPPPVAVKQSVEPADAPPATAVRPTPQQSDPSEPVKSPPPEPDQLAPEPEPVAPQAEAVIAPEPELVERPAIEPEPEPESKSARLPTPTVAPAPPPSWVRQEAAERSQQRAAPKEPIQTYLGLPQSFRNSLPQLNMNAHVFSTNPARSFVLINSKRYRIGDYLAEGPELLDILPDGAVLKYRGETFLFPVQR